MINRTTRLRWRRRYRRSRRHVGDIGIQAEEQLEQHFFKRLSRVWDVRRFIAGWISLLVILSIAVVFQTRALGNYYLDIQPVAGGTHTEGIAGSFTNASPLFATSLVDTTVSKLVFASLLTYNSQNKLVGDLAESWSVKDELSYTVTLKPNLKWQDGEELTAADVAFTFQSIQNPDTKSPLFSSWRGVTIKVLDERTITFTLTSPFSPFIYNLTTGIVPKHLLSQTDPAELRSANFNTTQPIGAGPFRWDTIEIIGNNPETTQQHIGLRGYDNYHSGKPKLDQFIIKTYANQDELLDAFGRQEISAMVGLEAIPDRFADDDTVQGHEAPLTAANMVLFKTSNPLLHDKRVRSALERAVNIPEMVATLPYPAILVDEPFLRGQLGYNPAYRQASPSLAKANSLLNQAGWKRKGPDQTRFKGSRQLSIKLYGKNNSDYNIVAQTLQMAWQNLGVKTEVLLQSDEDLQQTIIDRKYDALLTGIAIGLDPDVFAYWHSSQFDKRAPVRLNFSEYNSTAADTSLEAGRSRTNPSLRSVKYKPFLKAWQSDVPAIGLYQPRFFYVTRGPLYGFDNISMNSVTDRFANVEQWMVREGKVVKTE